MNMGKEYNGWSNYETWVAALYMDSDHWAEVARELVENDEDLDECQRQLADQMENEFEEFQPELKGVYADLLSAATQEINWDEIASNYIQDCKA
jgi:tryptophanyl-tRNA synthetase